MINSKGKIQNALILKNIDEDIFYFKPLPYLEAYGGILRHILSLKFSTKNSLNVPF